MEQNTLFLKLDTKSKVKKEEILFTLLEGTYSLGLALGIIVFYNHIGKRKLTQDPTPIAVEMRTYEADINKSLVELAEREGKTIDVS